MKNIFKTGLVAGILMSVAGFTLTMVFNMLIPSLQTEYMNEQLFRPWSDPVMSLFFLYPFIVGLTLAWLWQKIKKNISGTKQQQIINFGLGYWLIVGLPGMFVTYSNFQVSLVMVLSWVVNSLVYGLIAGAVFVYMNPKK